VLVAPAAARWRALPLPPPTPRRFYLFLPVAFKQLQLIVEHSSIALMSFKPFILIKMNNK